MNLNLKHLILIWGKLTDRNRTTAKKRTCTKTIPILLWNQYFVVNSICWEKAKSKLKRVTTNLGLLGDMNWNVAFGGYDVRKCFPIVLSFGRVKIKKWKKPDEKTCRSKRSDFGIVVLRNWKGIQNFFYFYFKKREYTDT